MVKVRNPDLGYYHITFSHPSTQLTFPCTMSPDKRNISSASNPGQKEKKNCFAENHRRCMLCKIDCRVMNFTDLGLRRSSENFPAKNAAEIE